MSEFHKGGGTLIDIGDKEEKNAYPGRTLRACFYSLIGEAPTLLPGDRTGANEYLNRIADALAHGGWSKTEWNRLYRLRDRWAARASGADARFEQVGNRRGGVTKREAASISERSSITSTFNTINNLLDRRARS